MGPGDPARWWEMCVEAHLMKPFLQPVSSAGARRRDPIAGARSRVAWVREDSNLRMLGHR